MLGLCGATIRCCTSTCIVTDGADFQPDVAVQIEPWLGGSGPLRAIGSDLSQRVLDELRRQGHMPLTLPDVCQRRSVLRVCPRSTAAAFFDRILVAQNRFAVLIETHSWKPFERRVRATYHAVSALLRNVAERAAKTGA